MEQERKRFNCHLYKPYKVEYEKPHVNVIGRIDLHDNENVRYFVQCEETNEYTINATRKIKPNRLTLTNDIDKAQSFKKRNSAYNVIVHLNLFNEKKYKIIEKIFA